jgi:hypothetical protein
MICCYGDRLYYGGLLALHHDVVVIIICQSRNRDPLFLHPCSLHAWHPTPSTHVTSPITPTNPSQHPTTHHLYILIYLPQLPPTAWHYATRTVACEPHKSQQERGTDLDMEEESWTRSGHNASQSKREDSLDFDDTYCVVDVFSQGTRGLWYIRWNIIIIEKGGGLINLFLMRTLKGGGCYKLK